MHAFFLLVLFRPPYRGRNWSYYTMAVCGVLIYFRIIVARPEQAFHARVELLDLLIGQGLLDVRAVDNNGRSPLHCMWPCNYCTLTFFLVSLS